MIMLFIVMWLSFCSVFAMEQSKQSFNKTIAQLSLSAQESKTSDTDTQALLEDLKSAFTKAIELANRIGEKSDNNGLIALHAKALEQLKLNPENFINNHRTLSVIISSTIMLKDPQIMAALNVAQDKTKEMQDAWLHFRKKVAYAAQAYVEDANPEIKFPPHLSGETKDSYGIKFITANKELDSKEDNNYNSLCASILTLLGAKDEQRKALLKECDIFNKL